MKKRCAKCHEHLPLAAFTRNRARADGLNHSYRQCHREYVKDHYEKNKAYYVAKARKGNTSYAKAVTGFLNWLKQVACADCHNSFLPVCMDFDHVRGKKKIDLADVRHRWWTLEQIQEEVMKCDVVCANCHRIRTHRRRAA